MSFHASCYDGGYEIRKEGCCFHTVSSADVRDLMAVCCCCTPEIHMFAAAAIFVVCSKAAYLPLVG